ncbi:MAG: Lipid A export ATP-binding/permease protein MsbA [Phycisphaerae bacterium]|nr:Lipid A export ATP-binding/permease protein MsbA [Phycisphaerae bacterium]
MSIEPQNSEPSAGGLLAQRRDRLPDRAAMARSFWRMLRLVVPHRRPMIWGVLLGLGVAATYAASLGGILPVMKVVVENQGVGAWLTGQAERHAGWYSPLLTSLAGWFPAADAPHARMNSLLVLVGVLVGINLLGNVLRCCSQYLVLYASNRVVMDLRRRMYAKALHLPLTSIADNVSNTVSQFMSDVREVFLGIVTLFGKVAREPLKAVCVLIVALAMDWRLTVVALSIAPIAIGFLWYFGRKVRKATVRLLSGYGLMLGSLEESLQGVAVVKAYARQGHERRRMWQLERRMFKHQLRLAWIESISSPLIEICGVLAAAAGIVWLGARTFAGEIDPSRFITMVVLLSAMLDPVRKIANVYNMVQRSGAAAHRIFEFLDWPEEDPVRDGPRLPAQAHEVRFAGVTFRYSPSAPPAVNDVTLTVSPGECVAIVGPNGSGKSTLLKLLPRFLEPQAGAVLIDGLHVAELNLRSLREHVAIVAQSPVIFARSVRENIAYGKPDATLDEVRDAARRAYAADFIEQWPNGYETVLGEFGTSVSGGQRQRIAIARALLKPASILIFDEATSEVDAESERRIHAALDELRRGKTTFLIAHRHTVMDMADRIVVMDEGQIVDAGTQTELLERCPLFQGLYAAHPV